MQSYAPAPDAPEVLFDPTTEITAADAARLNQRLLGGDAEPESTEDRYAAAAEQVKAAIALQTALREGTLTFAKYRTLPKHLKRQYRIRHGRPRTPDEVRGQQRRIRVRRVRAAQARQTRKAQRRRQG